MSSIFDSKLHFACTLPTYRATLPVSLLDCPLFPHPAMTLFRDTMLFIRRHFSARCLPDKSFIVQSATRDNVHSEPDNASVKGSYLFCETVFILCHFQKERKKKKTFLGWYLLLLKLNESTSRSVCWHSCSIHVGTAVD